MHSISCTHGCGAPAMQGVTEHWPRVVMDATTPVLAWYATWFTTPLSYRWSA